MLTPYIDAISSSPSSLDYSTTLGTHIVLQDGLLALSFGSSQWVCGLFLEQDNSTNFRLPQPSAIVGDLAHGFLSQKFGP